MIRKGNARIALIVTALTAATSLLLPATTASAANKGTIKVNGDASVDKNNEPHVGCDFTLTFWDYTPGTTVNVTFQPWAPTKGAAVSGGAVVIGSSPTASPVYNYSMFAGTTPHPEQGIHVKVTASVGKDSKTKVFWTKCTDGGISGTDDDDDGDDTVTGQSNGGGTENAPSDLPEGCCAS